MFKKMLRWVISKIETAQQSDVENYLAQSTSLQDLEYRMRKWEQRQSHQNLVL